MKSEILFKRAKTAQKEMSRLIKIRDGAKTYTELQLARAHVDRWFKIYERNEIRARRQLVREGSGY